MVAAAILTFLKQLLFNLSSIEFNFDNYYICETGCNKHSINNPILNYKSGLPILLQVIWTYKDACDKKNTVRAEAFPFAFKHGLLIIYLLHARELEHSCYFNEYFKQKLKTYYSSEKLTPSNWIMEGKCFLSNAQACRRSRYLEDNEYIRGP